ncbi:MAG: MarR family winged helix-turn-helix transcriptional regulator [Hyphomicrobiaceae bacterium]
MSLQHKRKLRDGAAGQRAVRSAIDTSDRTAHLVKDAGKAFVRGLQIRLAKLSIAHGHWTFLRILWKYDGITQVELSRRAGVMRPSTFAAVQAMEKLGYVERRQKPGNRKKVYIHLTPAGRALEAKLVPLAVDVNAVASKGLSASEIREFRRVLVKVIENLQRDEPT